MGDKSEIAWTDATWNPLVGCSRVSEGCRHCYAERMAHRLAAMGNKHYEAVTRAVLTLSGKAWNGKVVLVESALDLPLHWKKSRRIFVNSMSDLFHEKVPDEWLYQIFAVMALCPQHTFQILTKRPERMASFFKEGWDAVFYGYEDTPIYRRVESRGNSGNKEWYQEDADRVSAAREAIDGRPLPNVWLGVSVEDQATADARIPLLLQTPAAVRWVSYEPALGPVDFDGDPYSGPGWLRGWHTEPEHWRGCDGSCSAGRCPEPVQVENEHRLDWLVVGGESGPGARPFDLAWARSVIAQGQAAGVPVFMKQVGASPYSMTGGYGSGFGAKLLSPADADEAARWYPTDPMRDRKGGDPAEWPPDLRVRDYPK